MSARWRKAGGVVEGEAEFDRFLVKRQGALAAAQVALDLAQALERGHEVGIVALAPRRQNRIVEQLQRVLEATLAAGGVAALDQGVRILAHAGAPASIERVMNML
jgi:hypothetical protein